GVTPRSLYPNEATKLPKVGSQRQISAEGVLSLSPTLLLGSAETGPPPAIEQVRAAGIPVTTVSAAHDLSGARTRIREVAAALGREAEGRELEAKLDRELAAAQAALPQGSRPKVLVVNARGAGSISTA